MSRQVAENVAVQIKLLGIIQPKNEKIKFFYYLGTRIGSFAIVADL